MTPVPAAVMPPPARASAPPGRTRATEPGDDARFAATLDEAQARTAETEGQDTTGEPVADAAPEAAAGAQPTTGEQQPAADLPAVLPEEAAIAPVAVTVGAAGDESAGRAGEQGDPTGDQPLERNNPQAAMPAVPAHGDGPATSALPAQPDTPAEPAAPDPARAVSAAAAAPGAAGTPVPAGSAAPTPPPATAQRPADTVADGLTSDAAAAAVPADEAATVPSVPDDAAPAIPAQQARRDVRQADAPRTEPAAPADRATVAAAPAAPADAARAAQPSGNTAHVRRSGVLEGAQGLLELAVRHGMNRARLTLRPQELGGLEVRLHSTSAGLSASVRADTEATAATLQTALAELRRNLEQAGVIVNRLDVSWTGHGPHDGRHERSADPSRDGNGRRGGGSFDLDGGDDVEAVPVTAAPAPRADAGALLDVEA